MNEIFEEISVEEQFDIFYEEDIKELEQKIKKI